MPQPRSIEQLHQECYDELAPQLGDGSRGAAVSRAGWPAWLTPAVLSVILWWVMTGAMQRIGWLLLESVLGRRSPELEALHTKVEELGQRLEQRIEELKANPAAASSEEVQVLVRELKPLLQQLADQTRGQVTPREVNGARGTVLAKLLDGGLPEAYAEEVTELLDAKLLQPLTAKADKAATPASPPPAAPR